MPAYIVTPTYFLHKTTSESACNGDKVNDKGNKGILSGVKVLDVAHAYSAALSGALLADLGAEVLCIEHPTGSPVRQTTPKSQGQALWWKNMARGQALHHSQISAPLKVETCSLNWRHSSI